MWHIYTGTWMTNSDRNFGNTLFHLVFKGADHFGETCKIGQYASYFQSLVQKTQLNLMPSYCEDIKIILSEDDNTAEDKELKPVRVKLEFKMDMPVAKRKNWLSTFSTASKLLAKARKAQLRVDIKHENKAKIHTLIHSGQLCPSDIAAEARHSNKMIMVNCEVCNEQCQSLRRYVTHMTEHHPDFQFTCAICGRQYRTWSGKRKHERTHDGNKFVCMVCGRAFKIRDSLIHHMPVHDPEKKFYCETCGKGFAAKSTLKRHEKIHLNLSLPCENCERTFNTKEKLQRHWRGFHGPGVTTKCGQYTYKWPGKRQCHQRSCTDCAAIIEREHAEQFPDLRDS